MGCDNSSSSNVTIPRRIAPPAMAENLSKLTTSVVVGWSSEDAGKASSLSGGAFGWWTTVPGDDQFVDFDLKSPVRIDGIKLQIPSGTAAPQWISFSAASTQDDLPLAPVIFSCQTTKDPDVPLSYHMPGVTAQFWRLNISCTHGEWWMGLNSVEFYTDVNSKQSGVSPASASQDMVTRCFSTYFHPNFCFSTNSKNLDLQELPIGHIRVTDASSEKDSARSSIDKGEGWWTSQDLPQYVEFETTTALDIAGIRIFCANREGAAAKGMTLISTDGSFRHYFAGKNTGAWESFNFNTVLKGVTRFRLTIESNYGEFYTGVNGVGLLSTAPTVCIPSDEVTALANDGNVPIIVKAEMGLRIAEQVLAQATAASSPALIALLRTVFVKIAVGSWRGFDLIRRTIECLRRFCPSGPQFPLNVESPLNNIALASVLLMEFVSGIALAGPAVRVPDGISYIAKLSDVSADASGQITISVNLELDQCGKTGTGLYLLPNAVVTIQGAAGWTAHIGCHVDNLRKAEEKSSWKRFPEVTKKIFIHDNSYKIASPFGGLLYFSSDDIAARRITVIGGFIKAPYFANGHWVFPPNSPAPWAELEGQRAIMTVPSHTCSRLSEASAQAAVAFWDSAVLSHYELAGKLPVTNRRERFCQDVQLTCGWMHSGYPMGLHVDEEVSKLLLQPKEFLYQNPQKAWGFMHELGHNFQCSEWTWSGTTEITCNLFSLFTIERLLNPGDMQQLQFVREGVDGARELIQSRKGISGWEASPQAALWFFSSIVFKTGWEPFKKTFRSYIDDKEPWDNSMDRVQQQIDRFILRLSLNSGLDLRPHCAHWSVPLSDAVRAQDQTLGKLAPFVGAV